MNKTTCLTYLTLSNFYIGNRYLSLSPRQVRSQKNIIWPFINVCKYHEVYKGNKKEDLRVFIINALVYSKVYFERND